MLLTEKYKEQLQNILDSLNKIDKNYYLDLDEDDFNDNFVDIFSSFYNNNFRSSSGATKGVLIFKDFGFVIKIPFSLCDGCELYGSIDGEEWNYCAQEEFRFEKVEENNLEQIFLKTELIQDFDKYPIYIQEIAEPLNTITQSTKNSHTKEDSEKVENFYKKYECINIDWEADILALYGEEYYCRLKDFIEEYDINDLRSANIGYVGIRPVIFDYSGFYE